MGGRLSCKGLNISMIISAENPQSVVAALKHLTLVQPTTQAKPNHIFPIRYPTARVNIYNNPRIYIYISHRSLSRISPISHSSEEEKKPFAASSNTNSPLICAVKPPALLSLSLSFIYINVAISLRWKNEGQPKLLSRLYICTRGDR